MLTLLKSEECPNLLGEAARALGYSWRQCHRWFASYNKGGIEELLAWHRVRSPRRRRSASALEEAQAQDGPRPQRGTRRPSPKREQEAFKKTSPTPSADAVSRSRDLLRPGQKPLEVLAFDEARFGLINCSSTGTGDATVPGGFVPGGFVRPTTTS